jgi:serine/threonine-protein kinase RsbW
MSNSLTLNELNLDKLSYIFNSESDYYSHLNQILTDLHPFLSNYDSVMGNVELVLGEAINNGLTHGNKGDVSKQIKVEVWMENTVLYLSVEDEGIGFNYNDVPDPTLPDNREKLTGRGVFLMKSLADLVVFESNGSKVEIHFKL